MARSSTSSAADVVTRRGGADDVDAAADVLARAFADSPWTRWTVAADDHDRRIAQLQRLALARLGIPYGQVWLSTVDSDIVCVAAWTDSASPVPHSSFESMAPSVKHWEGDRHAASQVAEAGGYRFVTEGRAFHLGAVGTEPSRQRRGLATRTLAPVLREADQLVATCTLETSTTDNVAFYERLGFVVVDHRRVSGGGPDVWAMVRPGGR